MIPGANVLNMAFSIIARETVSYYAFVERGLNNVGQDVTTYAAPIDMTGSWQAVPRRLYQVYGLDLQKEYFMFYTSNNVLDIARDISGDQIVFQGRRFQCESDNDWFAMDGWKGVLCVLINEGTDAPVVGFNTTPESNSNENFDNGTFFGGGE